MGYSFYQLAQEFFHEQYETYEFFCHSLHASAFPWAVISASKLLRHHVPCNVKGFEVRGVRQTQMYQSKSVPVDFRWFLYIKVLWLAAAVTLKFANKCSSYMELLWTLLGANNSIHVMDDSINHYLIGWFKKSMHDGQNDSQFEHYFVEFRQLKHHIRSWTKVHPWAMIQQKSYEVHCFEMCKNCQQKPSPGNLRWMFSHHHRFPTNFPTKNDHFGVWNGGTTI